MSGLRDGASCLPAARLRRYIHSYSGYRLEGFAPGTHVGMPSPYLTVIITIGNPIEISHASHPEQRGGHWQSLASGISSAPCTIAHDGNQHGIQLALTPLGARAVFGIPTAALGAWMVDLDDVLGADARELRERISLHNDWDSRFAVLDDVLGRRAADVSLHPALDRAWHLLVGSRGRNRVADVADDVGWSRRHLVNRFTSEFGVTPKDSARIARFSAAHAIVRRPQIPSLAEVAAVCGYYDQAHMARDWRELAGMSASRWRASEVFAFIQDPDPDELADLSA